VLGSGELMAFMFARTHPSLFRPSPEDIAAALDFDAYREYLAKRYDAELGWQNPRATSLTDEDCLGQPRVYTWDENGARTIRPLTSVDIITVGDSFTHGHEASDTETYPYRLQEITGLTVANYGVNGYGPLQATLQFERVAPRHPSAHWAILGIMYLDIERAPNAWRYALRRVAYEIFHFKPFVDISGPEPVMRANPNSPPAQTLEQLRAKVEAALDGDYWRLPRPAFPYLLHVAELAQSPAVVFDLQRRLLGANVFVEYQNPALVRGLRLVIERFLSSSRARGIQPLVLFMPQNKEDLSSLGQLVATLRKDHQDTRFLDLAEAALDWDRYNLNGTLCHPSPYGYDQIARFVAAAIKPSGPQSSPVPVGGRSDGGSQAAGTPPSSLRFATKAPISSATATSSGGGS
jgi:hypothetical protein